MAGKYDDYNNDIDYSRGSNNSPIKKSNDVIQEFLKIEAIQKLKNPRLSIKTIDEGLQAMANFMRWNQDYADVILKALSESHQELRPVIDDIIDSGDFNRTFPALYQHFRKTHFSKYCITSKKSDCYTLEEKEKHPRSKKPICQQLPVKDCWKKSDKIDNKKYFQDLQYRSYDHDYDKDPQQEKLEAKLENLKADLLENIPTVAYVRETFSDDLAEEYRMLIESDVIESEYDQNSKYKPTKARLAKQMELMSALADENAIDYYSVKWDSEKKSRSQKRQNNPNLIPYLRTLPNKKYVFDKFRS